MVEQRDADSSEPPKKPASPEQELSDLIWRECDTRIPARRLRQFLLADWKKVTVLAHRIHDND